MASAVAQESSKDLPRLSLSIDRPASSSPFPSPGSPFLPPPRLGAHEFASKPDPVAQLMRNLDIRRKSQDKSSPPDENATPTLTTPSSSLAAFSPPITPTPNNSSFPAPPPPIAPAPAPAPASLAPDSALAAPLKPSPRDSLSLTSSRPAPPSPAVSRRASAALSRHSSTARSRRQSAAPSLSHDAVASSSSSAATLATPTAPTPTPTSTTAKRRPAPPVKIRDFAFPPADDRHIGKGPDVPRPNRPRRRWSSYSSSSSHSSACDDKLGEGQEEEDGRHAGGWSAFPWNRLSSHFDWGRGAGSASGSGGGGAVAVPSQAEMELNFHVPSPVDDSSSPNDSLSSSEVSSGDDDDDEELEEGGGGGGGFPSEDEMLHPGLYRALYAFEPEGTAEMELEEEQVVRVVGRGGGVGWAVVLREDGSHALVPESYLEVVEVDAEAA